MAHEVLPFPTVRPHPPGERSEHDQRDGRDEHEHPGADPCREQPPLRDVIGDVLRDERLEQQRTLAEVARQAAVSLPYLSEVERGRKEVSSDVLSAICDALDLPLADVLERSAQRLRPSVRGGSGMMLLAA
jgi:DNA-binding Xre family transcriptional regulator